MNEKETCSRPLVSVILAVYNEGRSIERCLSSLLKQETPDFDLEILAIDGGSQDGTPEILGEIAAADRRVRILRNPHQRTPFAFNLGLREARGEYVCVFGAHTIYKRNYITECLRGLLDHAAVGCCARVVTQPLDKSLQARLVAWIMSHPFGSSRKSFRTQAEGYVDHANYPVMIKKALIEAGGYDQEMTRNQDNDMSQKLRAKGYKLYCTWNSECYYYTKGRFRELLVYAWRNGFWNFISLTRNPGAMAARHFIPFLFVMGLASCALLAIIGAWKGSLDPWYFAMPFISVLGLHLAAGAMAAIQVAAREKSPGALWLPLGFFGFHAAYGIGTFSAIIRSAKHFLSRRLTIAWLQGDSSVPWKSQHLSGLVPVSAAEATRSRELRRNAPRLPEN
jgi:glycosyltransferase involved in cell wall biosynthesis